MAGREPTLAEIIDRAITSRLADLFLPMPAIVQAFYPASTGQAAAVDALPVVQRFVPTDSDGSLAAEDLPVVPNVPLVYPTGGGCRISWPLVPGDTVLLIPLYLAITQWRLSGLPSTAPNVDQGLHHLGNCVALAGLTADLGAPPAVPSPGPLTIDVGTGQVILAAGTVLLGAADAAEAVALASKVANELSAIQTTLGSASAPSGGGAVTFGSPYTPGDVASTMTKAKS